MLKQTLFYPIFCPLEKPDCKYSQSGTEWYEHLYEHSWHVSEDIWEHYRNTSVVEQQPQTAPNKQQLNTLTLA